MMKSMERVSGGSFFYLSMEVPINVNNASFDASLANDFNTWQP